LRDFIEEKEGRRNVVIYIGQVQSTQCFGSIPCV
jgi:hypothetical protein